MISKILKRFGYIKEELAIDGAVQMSLCQLRAWQRMVRNDFGVDGNPMAEAHTIEQTKKTVKEYIDKGVIGSMIVTQEEHEYRRVNYFGNRVKS